MGLLFVIRRQEQPNHDVGRKLSRLAQLAYAVVLLIFMGLICISIVMFTYPNHTVISQSPVSCYIIAHFVLCTSMYMFNYVEQLTIWTLQAWFACEAVRYTHAETTPLYMMSVMSAISSIVVTGAVGMSIIVLLTVMFRTVCPEMLCQGVGKH